MAQEKTTTKVMDPVCGKTVDPETAMFSTSYNGKTYYFDSETCKMNFAADPEKFLEG